MVRKDIFWETRSRHIRLAESQFAQPKTKISTLKRLRSAAEGKNLLWILLVFIYLHLREPHRPYQVPPPFFGRYQENSRVPLEEYKQEISRIFQGEISDPSDFKRLSNAYDENLTFADHVTGQILDQLKAEGLFLNNYF